ncbi:MAG: hypothetical protein LBU26_04215, partial [Synergistaceae bacterium]|nr:hypothetical protein [Synergistaceae bacterium]
MSGANRRYEKLRFVPPVCVFLASAAFVAGLFTGGGRLALTAAALSAVCAAAAGFFQNKLFAEETRIAEDTIEKLELERQLYYALYEYSPHSHFIIDENLKLVDCNEVTLEFMGVDDKQECLDIMTGKMEADIPKWNFGSGFTESIIAKVK